jgi:hypothetical protein
MSTSDCKTAAGERLEECPIELMAKAARIGEYVGLAMIEKDERNDLTKIFHPVLSLPFGYRIIRLQNRIAESNAIRSPDYFRLHSGFIQNGSARKSPSQKQLLMMFRVFKRLLIGVGLHKPKGNSQTFKLKAIPESSSACPSVPPPSPESGHALNASGKS